MIKTLILQVNCNKCEQILKLCILTFKRVNNSKTHLLSTKRSMCSAMYGDISICYKWKQCHLFSCNTNNSMLKICLKITIVLHAMLSPRFWIWIFLMYQHGINRNKHPAMHSHCAHYKFFKLIMWTALTSNWQKSANNKPLTIISITQMIYPYHMESFGHIQIEHMWYYNCLSHH